MEEWGYAVYDETTMRTEIYLTNGTKWGYMIYDEASGTSKIFQYT